MYKNLILLFISFLSLTAMAQVPPAFNYQAVARNTSGQALANQTLQVRLSIMQGATALYSETRSVTTNLLGLFNVQIGAAGATSSTGNFSTIQWLNNTPWMSLKVELDLSNNNVFTDMGMQPLTSVPYALAAETATETKNLATRPLDVTTVPNIGNKLMWNGTSWTPVRDTTIGFYKTFTSVSAGGGSTPWVFASTVSGLPVVTVNGNETIIASLIAALQNNSATPIPCAVDVCYQEITSGAVTSFSPGGSVYNDYLLPSSTVTPLTAVGTVKLPAGTYRIGYAIKNKSTTSQTIISPTNFIQGFIQVKR